MRDTGTAIKELKVDGGASRNNLMMQFQADLLNTEVIRPKITETTALGAAYLAGLSVNYWKDIDEIHRQWKVERKFSSNTNNTEAIMKAKINWADAVRRTLTEDNQH